MKKFTKIKINNKKVEKDLVSVVFPTMNRIEDLIKCIESLNASTHEKIEIIIADNGSTDGSAEIIRKMYPEVIIQENEHNLGSPIAINNCIKASKGEFILRLDDDEIVEPETIERMLGVLKSDPKIGMVGCLYFYTEEPNLLRMAGYDMNMWIGKTKVYGQDQEYHGQLSENIERDATGGGSHLARRSTFEEIGLYDETYFLNYEDVDWCLRLKRAGYKIVVVGSTRLYHKRGGGMSLKENPFRVYLLNRAFVLFMKKNAGLKNLFFLPFFFATKFPLTIFQFLKKGHIESARVAAKGVFDGLFNEEVFIFDKNKNKIKWTTKQQ